MAKAEYTSSVLPTPESKAFKVGDLLRTKWTGSKGPELRLVVESGIVDFKGKHQCGNNEEALHYYVTLITGEKIILTQE